MLNYKKVNMTLCKYKCRLSLIARQIQDFPEGANLKRGYQTIIQPNCPNNCMKMEKFVKREKHMFKILLCKSATSLCLPRFFLLFVAVCTNLCPLCLFMSLCCLHPIFPLHLFVSFAPACALFISTYLYLHTHKYFGPHLIHCMFYVNILINSHIMLNIMINSYLL